MPDLGEPTDRCWREARRIRTKKRRQGLAELAGRDPLQVEPGQELLDVPGPPQVRRQNLGGEADRCGVDTAAVTQLRPADLDRPDPGLDRPLGRMPVAHHPPPAVLVLELGMRGKKRLHLGLDRLGQHPPRPVTQHRKQRIVGDAGSWPGQPDNAILLHGVSLRVTSTITDGYAASCLIHQIRS